MVAPIDTSVIRDGNRQSIWWGVSSTDGTTLVPIQVDSSNYGVVVSDGTSTMAVMADIPEAMPRDGNRRTCVCAVSSADSTLLIPLSVDPATGAIQVQTT